MVIEFEDYPVFLKPKLRLFLSVDLIGSTALKHAPSLPLQLKDGEELNRSPRWLLPISDFYFTFEKYFREEWKELDGAMQSPTKLPTGTPPELWKANGDELIYTKDLDSRLELVSALLAWRQAIKRYRENLEKSGRLDVKSYAWTAGFPVHNSEVVFYRGSGEGDEPYSDDSRLLNYNLIERWHSQPDARDNLVRDFVGPSIDAGFRLATVASARRMAVSMDIVWLLATCMFPGNDVASFESMCIRYDGRQYLKGVLGGQPVPCFWLDLLHDDPLSQAEDKLDNAGDLGSQEEIKNFLDRFYDHNKRHIFRPFIQADEAFKYSKYPERYVELLKQWHSTWVKEKKRYELENPRNPAREKLTEGSDVSLEDENKVVTSLLRRDKSPDEA